MFCRKKYKLLTYSESWKENFRGKLIEIEERTLSIEDCLKNFSVREKLDKENSWYCGKCKDFKEATKQMELYKGNKILVMAFKRFSRVRKIRTPIKFPIEGLDLGPYFLCMQCFTQPTNRESRSCTTCTEWSTTMAV